MLIPNYENRSSNDILTINNYFESSGRAFKAISWLDYAKRSNNISALEYSALETRLSIEQLLFEQLIVSIGTKFDNAHYKECTGSAKKLTSLINKLTPTYEKLVEFTQAMSSSAVLISKWDNQLLIEYSGRVSQYLHWSGGLDETIQSENWFKTGVGVVEKAANYLWNGFTSGNTGVICLEKLEPEMFNLWELFSKDLISIHDAVYSAKILEPMLQSRLNQRKAATP